MRTAATLIGVLALGVAGCGGSEGPGDQSTGLVIVEQVQTGGPYYIEGAKSYVSAEPEGGGDGREVELSTGRTATGSLRLDAGRYTFKSWQRPCEGNCGYLDPPTDQCSAPVEVASGGETHVTIKLRPGKGCEIVLPS